VEAGAFDVDIFRRAVPSFDLLFRDASERDIICCDDTHLPDLVRVAMVVLLRFEHLVRYVCCNRQLKSADYEVWEPGVVKPGRGAEYELAHSPVVNPPDLFWTLGAIGKLGKLGKLVKPGKLIGF
jgi:hypothetical protein